MKKIIRDETILLIKRYLPEIGIQLPLTSETDIETIADFFEEKEITLSNALSCGDEIDRQLLDAVARAFDDLALFEDDDFHDIESLNRRLME